MNLLISSGKLEVNYNITELGNGIQETNAWETKIPL